MSDNATDTRPITYLHQSAKSSSQLLAAAAAAAAAARWISVLSGDNGTDLVREGPDPGVEWSAVAAAAAAAAATASIFRGGAAATMQESRRRQMDNRN